MRLRIGVVALTGVMLVAMAGCGDDKKSNDGKTPEAPPQPKALLLEAGDLPSGYRIDTSNPTDLGSKDGDTGSPDSEKLPDCDSIAEDPADVLSSSASAEADRTFVADTTRPYMQQYIARYTDKAQAEAAIKRLTDTTARCDGHTNTEDGDSVTYRAKQIPFPSEGDQTVATQLGVATQIGGEGTVGATANVVVVRVDNLVTLVMHHSRNAPSISDLEPVVKRAVEKLKTAK